MRVNETTLSLAETFIVGARWEKDFQVLARDPSLQGKRLGAILAHAELAHLQRQQFYHELEESTYQQYVLSPIVDALPVAEVDWRRTLWEAFYPRVRNEHDPVAAARVVVRALRERVGIDASYAYRVGPETVWELGMADEKGFARIYVAALRSVGIAARLGEAGQAEFWDGRAWQPAPRPLPSFSPDHTGQEGT
jgi:transglutaminase-like putative cysteine protease